MDTQSPTATNMVAHIRILPEFQVGDQAETDEPSPLQKMRNCTLFLEEGKKEANDALHLIGSVYRDIKEKTEANE